MERIVIGHKAANELNVNKLNPEPLNGGPKPHALLCHICAVTTGIWPVMP
jgi:hypothetical protein